MVEYLINYRKYKMTQEQFTKLAVFLRIIGAMLLISGLITSAGVMFLLAEIATIGAWK